MRATLARLVRGCVTTLVVAAVLVIVVAAIATAHDAPTGWRYDPACCSNQDCHPIMDNEVRLQPDGSYVILATKERFVPPNVPADYPVRNFKWSKDQSFHRCNSETGNYSYCLYVPMPSM